MVSVKGSFRTSNSEHGPRPACWFCGTVGLCQFLGRLGRFLLDSAEECFTMLHAKGNRMCLLSGLGCGNPSQSHSIVIGMLPRLAFCFWDLHLGGTHLGFQSAQLRGWYGPGTALLSGKSMVGLRPCSFCSGETRLRGSPCPPERCSEFVRGPLVSPL